MGVSHKKHSQFAVWCVWMDFIPLAEWMNICLINAWPCAGNL
jgi:hypothetical protein